MSSAYRPKLADDASLIADNVLLQGEVACPLFARSDRRETGGTEASRVAAFVPDLRRPRVPDRATRRAPQPSPRRDGPAAGSRWLNVLTRA